ncbi:DUF4352 domain-containing protein [Streptomyces bobili]|uniref:DUF4352 domain-containing protein n=1 Tax=Streptomyces bobili TaxID=67280 RepID=UPI00341D7DB2
MNTRTAACAALFALVALATACSSDDAADSTPKPSASAAAAASSASPPSPIPSKARTIGDMYSSTREDQGLTFQTTSTVLGYEHDFKAQASAAEETGAAGYVWSALEIKVCAQSDGISVSRFPWVLAYADGARVEASGTTYGDFPKPEYPIEAKVKNGDCVRGKIAYAVPGNQRPVKVIYAPDGLPEPVEWTMPVS